MSHTVHKTHFIRNLIEADLRQDPGKPVITRFPPEPNGYLHIGHAKSICLNFGLAQNYGTHCFLRFDDTNPCTEDQTYVEAIMRDVRWLGFDWGEQLRYASDYFQVFYDCAVHLIKTGKAYVCSLSPEAVRTYRGTLTEPGKNSPDRDRSIEENLALFTQMRAGVFEEGQYALRAKIDMAAANINLRDPTLYRIRKVAHPHVGDQWCIYPMYDYAHPLSDAIEGITYSLCTLEFQDHRPLYDWVIEHSGLPGRPKQIEFSRLNVTYTMTSKRKLKQLVTEGVVSGWDDPRMPTLSGLRRRGVAPEALRDFCAHVGVSKQDSVIDVAVFEEMIRNQLNQTAPRRMAVLYPLTVVIENYPEDQVERLTLSNHPNHPEWGSRTVPMSRVLYIDRMDFQMTPHADFFRLTPGGRVRLFHSYVIECVRVSEDQKTLYCRYLPETLGGQKPADGRKVKGIIHWLSAAHAHRAEVRLYDRLFQVENPNAEADLHAALNPAALTILKNAYIEPDLANTTPEARFQFNRLGYFCADQHDHTKARPVFNQTVGLKG